MSAVVVSAARFKRVVVSVESVVFARVTRRTRGASSSVFRICIIAAFATRREIGAQDAAHNNQYDEREEPSPFTFATWRIGGGAKNCFVLWIVPATAFSWILSFSLTHYLEEVECAVFALGAAQDVDGWMKKMMCVYSPWCPQ